MWARPDSRQWGSSKSCMHTSHACVHVRESTCSLAYVTICASTLHVHVHVVYFILLEPLSVYRLTVHFCGHYCGGDSHLRVAACQSIELPFLCVSFELYTFRLHLPADVRDHPRADDVGDLPAQGPRTAAGTVYSRTRWLVYMHLLGWVALQ